MSPTTRALLAAAREGLGPDPAAAARVRAKLDAALAGGAAAAAPVAATGSFALKLAALVVAAATIAAVTIPHRAAAPTPAPPISLDEAAHVDVPVPTVHTATREPAAPPAIKPVVVHVARVEAPAPAPVVEVSLAREVELIDDAMGSLRAGNATAALAAIAAFHRETGDRGQLLEDASAIEIEASCNLHLDVRSKLAAFDKAWPSSAQRARLTAACP